MGVAVMLCPTLVVIDIIQDKGKGIAGKRWNKRNGMFPYCPVLPASSLFSLLKKKSHTALALVGKVSFLSTSTVFFTLIDLFN